MYVSPFQPLYKVNSKRCIKIIRATNLKLVKVSLKGSSQFTSNDKNFGPRGVVIICNTVMPESENMGVPVLIDGDNLSFPFGIGLTDLSEWGQGSGITAINCKYIVTCNSCFLGMCRSQENPSIVVNKGEILHLLPDHPDRLDDVSPIPEFKPAVKPQLFILEDTPYISVVQSVLQRPKLERPSSRYDKSFFLSHNSKNPEGGGNRDPPNFDRSVNQNAIY